MGLTESIRSILIDLYPSPQVEDTLQELISLIERFPKQEPKRREFFSEKDVILITYGDSLLQAGEFPLQTFYHFSEDYLKGIFSGIHFLPFFPFSSDDGFSVMDYYQVKKDLGNWNDIHSIGNNFELMFDFVLNHISAKSDWFKKYLQGEKDFEGLAIEVDPKSDLSQVVRPRTLPLLTEFQKTSGEQVYLWTTFSADQVDLNYEHPQVLIRVIEVLLFYVQQGARIIRMDAIAYLWKELGTSCIHLNQTHRVVQLFRLILSQVAPDVLILTETNVPHQENLSYLGDGSNEAHIIYNFTLPPLLIHTLIKEDATGLSSWASSLRLESKQTTFFNFTASHDGIGVRPLEGILKPDEIQFLAEQVKKNGGHVSSKQNRDGGVSPYELNITYIDALQDKSVDDDQTVLAKRFLASQAIMLSLPGVPAVYIHSLLGSRNWDAGVELTGMARSINREKLQLNEVVQDLKNSHSFRSKIYWDYRDMIRTRRSHPAFHPNASFEILNLHPQVFSIVREYQGQRVVSLTNISSKSILIKADQAGVATDARDLITRSIPGTSELELKPYQFVWLSNA